MTDSEFDLRNDGVKQALKEGIREWLDDAFAEFGKWTLKGILAAALAGLTWLAVQGWIHK